MDTPTILITLFAGLYLLHIGVVMKTISAFSAFTYKTVPVLLGLACLGLAAHELGIVVVL